MTTTTCTAAPVAPVRYNEEVTDQEAQLELEEMCRAEKLAMEAATIAGPAFERLLVLAETRNSGQISKVVRFLACCYNWSEYRWDFSELRGLDSSISDDILSILHSQTRMAPYPYDLPGVRDGEARLALVIEAWKPIRWVPLERE